MKKESRKTGRLLAGSGRLRLDPAHTFPRSDLRRAWDQLLQRLTAGQAFLTRAGARYARRLIPRLEALIRGSGIRGIRRKAPTVSRALPHWDAETHCLFLGSRVLKEFRHPAPNQTKLLDVFDEEGWTGHIDDPLSPIANEKPEQTKLRLHETIKNLNRSMPPGTIRFRGDGTGQGVTWEYAPRAPRKGTLKRRRR